MFIWEVLLMRILGGLFERLGLARHSLKVHCSDRHFLVHFVFVAHIEVVLIYIVSLRSTEQIVYYHRSAHIS